MEYFIDFFSRLLELASSFLLIFNKTLFTIGESDISIGTIIIFFLTNEGIYVIKISSLEMVF